MISVAGSAYTQLLSLHVFHDHSFMLLSKAHAPAGWVLSSCSYTDGEGRPRATLGEAPRRVRCRRNDGLAAE